MAFIAVASDRLSQLSTCLARCHGSCAGEFSPEIPQRPGIFVSEMASPLWGHYPNSNGAEAGGGGRDVGMKEWVPAGEGWLRVSKLVGFIPGVSSVPCYQLHHQLVCGGSVWQPRLGKQEALCVYLAFPSPTKQHGESLVGTWGDGYQESALCTSMRTCTPTPGTHMKSPAILSYVCNTTLGRQGWEDPIY